MTSGSEPKGRFAANSPRLLTATPKAIRGYSPLQLRRAIRMSEGRVIGAIARVRGPASVDGVCNVEVCAACGADIIGLGLYDPNNPYFPGLPNRISKEPDDTILNLVQAELGRGWTAAEVGDLVGRPLAASMYGIEGSYPDKMEHSFTRVTGTAENAALLVEQGFALIQFMDWVAPVEAVADVIHEISQAVDGRALVSFGRPNGAGLFGEERDRPLFTVDEVKTFVKAGADMVEMPAVGTQPGMTLEVVSKLVETVRAEGALANLWIASSQEGADVNTVRMIALESKKTRADMFTISDVHLNESNPDPENLLAMSIAIRGRRHTYRRMAMSPGR